VRVTKKDTTEKRRDPPFSTLRSPSGVLQAALLALAFVTGFVIHQQGWHRPLVSFIQRPAFAATALLRRSDLPTLYVDMQFEDYRRLLDKHEQAMRLGVNIVSDQDYVPADVRYDDTGAAVEMRLLQGPVDGEWPFDVVLQDDGTLLDLHHFTLAPAGPNVLSTWGYLETLRRAGLLSARYHILELVFNGSSKGVYVLEEQLASEPPDGERPGLSVVHFDHSAYWDAYAQLGDALPGSGFQYARIVANCDPASLLCDDIVPSLQTLESGERAPSDVMDTDRVGAFLALTTLWRGTPELDWRTTYLGYDPATMRFEPVGASGGLSPIAPLPGYFTGDPLIQIAHARALIEFSRPDYLAQLRSDLENDMNGLQRALGAEMGYLELPWAALETHQAIMRRQLTPAHTLFARIEADEADTALVLHISNTQPFPIEIVGLDIGENVFLDVNPGWVIESDRALLVDTPDGVVLRAAIESAPRNARLRVPPESLPRGHEWDWQNPGEIHIVTRLFGVAEHDIVVTVE